jgi:hypothetical protein
MLPSPKPEMSAEDTNMAALCYRYPSEKKGDAKAAPLASVPVPTFVSLCRKRSRKRRNQRGTSKALILVPLFDLKFLPPLPL